MVRTPVLLNLKIAFYYYYFFFTVFSLSVCLFETVSQELCFTIKMTLFYSTTTPEIEDTVVNKPGPSYTKLAFW